MDVKDDSSPSSAHAQGRLIAVRPNRAPGAASPSDSNPSKPSTADDEDAAWSPPPAPRPDPQGAAKSAAGKSAASRVRKPRQPNNGKSPLFWVHMDQQSVPEGKKEDTLKRIRSHVMSEHNRRKRLESSRRYMNKAWKHLASQPVDTTATAPDQAGSSRVDSQSDIPDSSSTEQEGDGELPLDALGFPTSPATGAASVASDTGALVSRLSPAEASPWPYLGSGSNDPFSMTHTSLSNRMVWHMQYCKSFRVTRVNRLLRGGILMFCFIRSSPPYPDPESLSVPPALRAKVASSLGVANQTRPRAAACLYMPRFLKFGGRNRCVSLGGIEEPMVQRSHRRHLPPSRRDNQARQQGSIRSHQGIQRRTNCRGFGAAYDRGTLFGSSSVICWR